MARKSADLEMKGGKSPRQRIWEVIRTKRSRFTQADLTAVFEGAGRPVIDYLQALIKANIIEVIAEEPVNGACVRKIYRLVRDSGVEAPRIAKNGELVVQGAGTEAMWGTMHRIFERKDFDFRELAAFASTSKLTISEATANAYIRALAAAGYLRMTSPAKQTKPVRPARFILIQKMYTGPRAPMVQRTKVVFDPNENRVMWADTKEIEDAL